MNEYGTEKSNASKYIQELIDSNEAWLVPQKLVGKDKGWEFEVGDEKLIGYQAVESHLVKIDHIRESLRGTHKILYIGKVDILNFEGKSGMTDHEFVII